ncbi:MAG: hypothetical protein ABIJ34_00770 [archaeon]
MKAQMSIFVIVGIVITIVIGSYFMMRLTDQQNNLGQASDYVFEMGSKQSSLNAIMQECLKQHVIAGELEYGLHRTWSTSPIREYIKTNLPGCIQTFVTQQGYKMTAGELEVVVDIQQESVVVDVHYPIMLVKQDTILRFEQQTYTFPRMTMEKIDPEKTTRVVSADGTMIVEIPPGTIATLNGEPVETVGLKQLDREFNGLRNSVTGGMLAFNGYPHGTRFSKPITVIHFYKDEDVPVGVNEEDLRLGYYDDVSKIWKSLPTIVDPDKNKMVMQTIHFSAQPGLLVQCTEGATWTAITEKLVYERCTPAEWHPDKQIYACQDTKHATPTTTPDVLWIKQDGIDPALCSEGNGCGSECLPLDSWKSTAAGLGDCHKSVGGGETGCGTCECCDNKDETDESYYKMPIFYYAANPTGTYTGYPVNFAGEGNSCQAGNLEDDKVSVQELPLFADKAEAGENANNIRVVAKTYNGETDCAISRMDSGITDMQFTFDEACTDSQPNSYYAGYAEITGQGFGAKGALYSCEGVEPGTTQDMPLATGGDANKMVSATCTCGAASAAIASTTLAGVTGTTGFGSQVANAGGVEPGLGSEASSGPCVWIPAEGEKCGSATCTATQTCDKSADPNSEDPDPAKQDQDSWVCKDSSAGGGGGSTCTPPCTGRQTCKDGKCVAGGGGGGGGAECGTSNGPCDIPDFDTRLKGKSFTTDKVIDTRDKKMCDSFGDLPSGSKLIIMDHVKRGVQCWLFVELQQVTDGFKPDLYIRYDDVKHLLPSEGDDNETKPCEKDSDCKGGRFCHPVNKTCVGAGSLIPIVGFYDVPTDKLQEAKDFGAGTLAFMDSNNEGSIPVSAAKEPFSFEVITRLNDTAYNNNKAIADYDFSSHLNNESIGYWILSEPCNTDRWSLTYDNIGGLYDKFKTASKKPVFVDFANLNCALDMFSSVPDIRVLADYIMFDIRSTMTNDDINAELRLVYDVGNKARLAQGNARIIAFFDIDGASPKWINETARKILENEDIDGIIISPYSRVSQMQSDIGFRNTINEVMCLANQKYRDIPCEFVAELPDTPQEYKVVFIANQGTSQDASDVLSLINSKEADLIIIDGNMGYDKQPFEWDNLMTETSIPVLATIGDMDKEDWPSYVSLIEPYDDSVECTGTAGDKHVCRFNNVTFILSGVGISNTDGNIDFITGAATAADTAWKFCVWHKSNDMLRVSDRSSDDTLALPYYKACLDAGAVIITGYDNQYARTKEITNLEDSVGFLDVNSEFEVRPGHSIIIDNGLGGFGSDRYDCGKDANNWWASIYTPNYYMNNGLQVSKSCTEDTTSGFAPGALFFTFNYQGNENRTHGEFVNVNNVVVDSFDLVK